MTKRFAFPYSPLVATEMKTETLCQACGAPGATTEPPRLCQACLDEPLILEPKVSAEELLYLRMLVVDVCPCGCVLNAREVN